MRGVMENMDNMENMKRMKRMKKEKKMIKISIVLLKKENNTLKIKEKKNTADPISTKKKNNRKKNSY